MHLELLDTLFAATMFVICHCSKHDVIRVYMSGDYGLMNNTKEYWVHAASHLMCARLCDQDEGCATFSFDKTKNICHMADVAPSAGVVFGPYIAPETCPRKIGYRIYVRQKLVLCLKYRGTKVTNTVARSLCYNEGAHLVLLENRENLEFVSDIGKTYTWMAVHVDGYDADGDGNYTSFRGEHLSFMPFKTYVIGQLCVRLPWSSRKLKSTDCDTDPRRVVCQIDV